MILGRKQKAILKETGIQAWEMKSCLSSQSQELEAWSILEKEVQICQLCALSCSRTQTVFGTGNKEAALFIIGEAPGFYEDKQGQPFVGQAGQLLTRILEAVGLHRPDVFIANVLKCRPPDNRDPHADEVLACTPYLKRQLDLVQPKLILALGRHAAHYLLNNALPLNRLREGLYSFGESAIPVMVTYHPAYLLRNPIEKRKAYDDWLRVVSYLK
jgi:uracil-DNA glycosylase